MHINARTMNNSIPLTAWLKWKGDDNPLVTRRVTFEEWSQAEPPQQGRTVTSQQGGPRGGYNLEERLGVAIAATRAIRDMGESSRQICSQTLMGLMNLDFVDNYCHASVDVTKITEEPTPVGMVSTAENTQQSLRSLGYVLNAIFGGESSDLQSVDVSREVETGQLIKKRMTNQMGVGQNVPLYVACIISAIFGVAGNDSENSHGYQIIDQVLHDLEVAARKPGTYFSDAAERFSSLQIPSDAFFGREAEVHVMKQAFDSVLQSGKPILCTVSGFAGAGKTALVNQIKGPLIKAGGTMIRVNFDKFLPSDSVLFSALDCFFDEINNGNEGMQAHIMRIEIAENLGCWAGSLMSAIPSLRTFLNEEKEHGKDTIDEYELQGETNVSHQQWKLLLSRLIKAIIASRSHPIALVLDDLHWCDERTLDIIQAIMVDADVSHCLYLGTHRSEEIKSTEITRTFEAIQRDIQVVNLKVSCIERDSLNSLISEVLCMPPSLCQPLSSTVHSKTGMNILFATNFLMSLYEEGRLRFNLKTRQWEYSITDIMQRKLPVDLVQHLSERMKRLPNNVQTLLKISAFLGFEFDADLLQRAIQVPMQELLTVALESGFLKEESKSPGKIVFTHDQIHLAAYSLVPSDKHQPLHMLIGSRIYMSIPSEDDELLYKHIFDICKNMNIGVSLCSQDQKNEIAQLNLTAGKKSMQSSSYVTAADHFMTGIGLLDSDCWINNYKLSILLHQAASEALFASGKYDTLEHVINDQLKWASSDDKHEAQFAQIRFLYASGNAKEASSTTFSVLADLGEDFPEEATPEMIYKEMLEVKGVLQELTIEDIRESPRLTDKSYLWRVRFMDRCLKDLISTRPDLVPLVSCRIIRISLEHGYCVEAIFGFASYSTAQINVFQDIEEGYKWYKICLFLAKMLNAPQGWIKRLLVAYHIFQAFWKEPIQASCDILLATHQDLQLAGDVEYSMIAIFNHCRHSLFCGKPLAQVDDLCVSITAKMSELSLIQSNLSLSSHHLLVLKLIGNSHVRNPFNSPLFAEIFSEEDLLLHAISTGKTGIAQAIRFNRLFAAFYLKDYHAAAEEAKLYKSRTIMPLIDAQFTFYHGMTALYFCRYSYGDEHGQWLQIGENALSDLRKRVSHSTWNAENKLLLLEASWHFAREEMEMAEEKYIAAVESSQKHRFVHEEGLAHDLFATFCRSNEDTDKEMAHVAAARFCYEKWGALALIELLDSPGNIH